MADLLCGAYSCEVAAIVNGFEIVGTSDMTDSSLLGAIVEVYIEKLMFIEACEWEEKIFRARKP